MERVKIGIIGCGTIAEGQARAAIQLDNTQLIAVCDVNYDTAKAFARKLGITKIYEDYHLLLEDPEIDAIYNCTPNFMHSKVAVAAAEAGKHILTQKPFANSLAEAKAMDKAARDNGVILQAGFFERFRGYCRSVKQCIEEGRIGTVHTMKAQMSHEGIGRFYHPKTEWFDDISLAGGGSLADLGSHHLDLLRWFADSEIKEIDAQLGYQGQSKVEKNAVVNMKFENGVLAQGYWSFGTVAPKGVCFEKLEIYGDKGTIFVEWDEPGTPRFRIITQGKEQWEDISYEDNDGFYEMEKHFSDCILTDSKPITTGFDGIKSVETILTAYESARLGSRVTIGKEG